MVNGNFMKCDDVINYMTRKWGSLYSRPHLPIHTIEDIQFYSTTDVKSLMNYFDNPKKEWIEIECNVSTFMFGFESKIGSLKRQKV